MGIRKKYGSIYKILEYKIQDTRYKNERELAPQFLYPAKVSLRQNRKISVFLQKGIENNLL